MFILAPFAKLISIRGEENLAVLFGRQERCRFKVIHDRLDEEVGRHVEVDKQRDEVGEGQIPKVLDDLLGDVDRLAQLVHVQVD